MGNASSKVLLVASDIWVEECEYPKNKNIYVMIVNDLGVRHRRVQTLKLFREVCLIGNTICGEWYFQGDDNSEEQMRQWPGLAFDEWNPL